MASKVSVGKTAPVPLGQQPAANSLPVVFAEDQQPIPVEEQNKIQSEVALSLLGIPRSEVALGIFADVNTYDINPTEWAQDPIENVPSGVGKGISHGVEHIPDEAGARLVASDGKTTILTSKRFFRYQPGRVSASTMGVKMNVTEDPDTSSATGFTQAEKNAMKGAPSLKKWGIFDKFDGYYFEIANAGLGNDFRCVRRTQAIIKSEQDGYTGPLSWLKNGGAETGDALPQPNSNFGEAGVDPVIMRDGLIYVAAAINDPSLVYSPDDVRNIDGTKDADGYYPGSGERLKNYSFNSNYAVRLATYNGSTWTEHMADRKFMFPFDQSKTIPLEPKGDTLKNGYIRSDCHCNFYQTISNFNRKGNWGGELTGFNDFTSTAANKANWGTTAGTPSQYSDIDTWYTGNNTDAALTPERKIWHLLVNVQGSNKITSAQFVHPDNCLPSSPNVKGRSGAATNGNVTLKEWFNLCVPAPYRMVYEWRPVRAMFSGDKLDGGESVVRWSDINTAANDTTAGNAGGGAINRPGDVVKTADNEDLKTVSAYEIDFTKVTMWKTEFSWYGAVGAVFLCYVPVSNGEARWVRVHHIRASNQHSVASLGNATLPITYLTHNSGLGEQPANGHTLTKYGASYYIDGGDKGTVRLLSKASDFNREVAPGFLQFPGGGNIAAGGYEILNNNVVEINVNSYTGNTADRRGLLRRDTVVGLMGAYLDGDVTNKVKWVGKGSVDGNARLYFTNQVGSGTSSSPGNAIKIIIPRAQKSLLSFRAKDFILNRKGDEVRNRLQIYPLKLGAGIAAGSTGDLMTLRTIKNPLKIISNVDIGSNNNTIYGQGTFAQTPGRAKDPANANTFVNTKTSTLAVEVDFTGGQVDPTDILPTVGDYRFGYFMGSTSAQAAQQFDPTSDASYLNSTVFPVIGKLRRTATNTYQFSKLYSYPENVYIAGYFLPERHLELGEHSASAGYQVFNELGLSAVAANKHADSTDQSKWDKLEASSMVTWEEITRLSGARVGQDMKLTPIADTGNEILAYYGGPGGYQFDLQDYFAYNKEYLSFPLTDEVDILNIYGHYDISTVTVPNLKSFYVNTALTWEEQ